MAVPTPLPPVAAEPPAMHRPPVGVGIAVLVGALAAGVFAVHAPIPGIALAVLVLIGTLLRNVRVGRMAPVLVTLTAVAAIAGPNLAAPQAPWLFGFRILIVTLGLGLLGWWLMGGRLSIPVGLRRPAGILLVWLTWTLLSVAWATDTVAALRWTLFMAMMAGLAIGLAMLGRDRRRVVTLLRVLVVVFAFAVALALVEVTLGVRLPTSALLGQDRATAFAATSLFGNQNNFATYLTLTLPYFAMLPIVFRDVRLRFLGIAGTLAALTGLLYTGSKSNLLASGLILIGLLVVLAADRANRQRLFAALGVTALAVGLVVPSVLGGGLIPLPERAVTKFDFSLLFAQREASTGSGAVRSYLALDALGIVANTNGLGVGAGNAEVRVREETTYTAVANLHNWWLEVTVNGGLIGIALYLAFYLTLLRGNLRAAKEPDDPLLRYLGLAGALALVGYVAGCLGPSTAIHFAPMWITFGLAMITLVRHGQQRVEREAGTA